MKRKRVESSCVEHKQHDIRLMYVTCWTTYRRTYRYEYEFDIEKTNKLFWDEHV